MIAPLALAVISAAILAYEVLLVRLFAIVQWHHFAFMAISIALLGFGMSGTLLAIWQDWARPRFAMLFASGAALFALSAPASFLAAQALPFNALAVVWQPVQLLYLPAIYLLLMVPFFFGASCIGLAFIRYGERIGRIYAFNLIGSAAGALGLVALLLVLSPSDMLRLVVVVGFLAAALVAWNGERLLRRALTPACALLAVAAWAVVPDSWLALRISEYKGLPVALQVSGARLLAERSSPLGLLSVVESPEVPFRYVPGLSLKAPGVPPAQLGVFIDGDSMTAITAFDDRREALAYLDYTTDALAYHLLERPAVLVLGAGGGQSVLQALYHQAKRIDAVELDRNMVRLVRDDFAGFAGRLYSRPEVTVHLAEARGFVAARRERWDLIQLPLLDAASARAGVHGLSESYLYTVEAFQRYLTRLEPGGWLSITRWLKLPPRDTLKLFATALDALRRSGVEAPERALALIRGLTTATLLVKKGAIGEREIARIKAFAEERAFDLGYYPGMRAAEANRYNVLDQPYFFAGATALAGAGRADFVARYKFDIAPATDERPYFFDFLKWSSLPELLALRRSGGAALLELGRVILVATLAQAAALSALLILAPLWVRRRALVAAPRLWRSGAYFFALGLAFLFLEIAFIQKLILFLSHPVYAVAVVLTAFLLFAGIGSGLSARLDCWWAARFGGAGRYSSIDLAAAAIAALSLAYLALLPPLFDALFHLPDLARILVALAVIAPLAFFMGLPFPLGLQRVRSEVPRLVPWAWGVNGCASVLSAPLATLLAMSFGFSTVVLAAALLYAAAAAALRSPAPAPAG